VADHSLIAMTMAVLRPGLLCAAGVAAAGAVTLAGAATAAPSGADSVDLTVESLRAQGYNVIVRKAGAAPLDDCEVSALRPAEAPDGEAWRRHPVAPTDQTVYVEVTC
jgi:hypothetical protein